MAGVPESNQCAADPGTQRIEHQHRQALAGPSVGFDVEVEGRTYQAHVEPPRDAAARSVAVIGVAHDVTDSTRLRQLGRR